MEKKIIQARLEGKSFSELTPDEARVVTDQIMLRGAAISGCALPHTDFFADFISSELALFINDFGFRELTQAEILLALRLNAKRGVKSAGEDLDNVEFYGSVFNVSFMAKVLANYQIRRNETERKLQILIDGYL